MYLNSKSYEIKYRKYKNKYKKLKSQLGGECTSLPNPEEEDIITKQNLLDLCPEERITMQNKCYEVNSLYKWIINEKKPFLPTTMTIISHDEKQELIEAYEKFTQNILTRDILIQIYPNLQNEKILNLYNKNYTGISLDTFATKGGDNLQELKKIYLMHNKIKKIQPGIFYNNLQALKYLNLENNQIKKLQSDTFYNLPSLRELILTYNQIEVLEPDIFNNVPKLQYLKLSNNNISNLQLCVFNNLPKL